MDSSENGLRRRSLLKSVAAFFATEVLPAPKVFRTLLSVTANMPTETIRALPAARALCQLLMDHYGHMLSGYTTVEEIVNGKIIEGFVTYDEMFGEGGLLSDSPLEKSYSDHLANAWERNIDFAGWRWETSQKLERTLTADFDMPPRVFSHLLSDTQTQKDIAAVFSNRDINSPTTIFAVLSESEEKIFDETILFDHEHMARRLSQLTERYPGLNATGSMKELIVCLRQDISGALALPLENGCFDRLAVHSSNIALDTLIDVVPDLFPKGKLYLFRHIAKDLRMHGRQTVRIEDIPEIKDDWYYRGLHLPYRLGLTPLQANPTKLEL